MSTVGAPRAAYELLVQAVFAARGEWETETNLTLFYLVQVQQKGCHSHLLSRSSMGQQSRGGMDKGLGASLVGRNGGIEEAFSEEGATGPDMDVIASLQSPRCGRHRGKAPMSAKVREA